MVFLLPESQSLGVQEAIGQLTNARVSPHRRHAYGVAATTPNRTGARESTPPG